MMTMMMTMTTMMMTTMTTQGAAVKTRKENLIKEKRVKSKEVGVKIEKNQLPQKKKDTRKRLLRYCLKL